MDKPDAPTPRPIQVTDIEAPISAMAWWLIKLALASIPAAALLFLLGVAGFVWFAAIGRMAP